MQIIKINPSRPSSKIIKIVARVIKNGGVVIYPTDTIYGIGANALDKQAIKKIYNIKQRPENKPLSVVVGDARMAEKYCAINKLQEEIFDCLLPGPFTLIFRAKPQVKSKIFTLYKSTLSLRIPDYKITKMLARELKIPFTSTSANISGLPGSGNIKNVLDQLVWNVSHEVRRRNVENIDLVLDAGILPKRKPSTIIDLTGEESKVIRK